MTRILVLVGLLLFLIGAGDLLAQEARERQRTPPPSARGYAVPRSSKPLNQRPQVRSPNDRNQGSRFNFYFDFDYRQPYYRPYRAYPRYYNYQPMLVCQPDWVVVGYDRYGRPVYDWIENAYCYYRY